MLKHKIEKSDYEKFPESIRAEYEEKDGFYFLQTEGLVPKAKLDEFRENNIKLAEENKSLKSLGEKFGELTPDKLLELKEKAALADSKLSDKDVKGLVDAEVEKRVVKMKEDHAGELLSRDETISKNGAQLSTLIVDSAIASLSLESGIVDSALKDVQLRARGVFKVVEGKAVPHNDSGEIIYSKDGVTPLSMNEWMGEREKDSSHWFKKSSGASGQERKPSGAVETLSGIDRMNAARAQ